MNNQIDFFLGLGQGSWSVKWLSKRLPTITFHAAPHYLHSKNNAAFEENALDWVERAYAKTEPGIVIAESQAAPAVVAAIKAGRITLPSRLILLQPLGLNYGSFGKTKRERFESLMRRSRLFWLHKNQALFIPGNFVTFISIAIDTIMFKRNLKAALIFAANQNIVHDVEMLAQRLPIDIYACTRDSLFPYDELRSRLSPDLGLRTIEGTHLNRATPKGLNQLKTILHEIGTIK